MFIYPTIFFYIQRNVAGVCNYNFRIQIIKKEIFLNKIESRISSQNIWSKLLFENGIFFTIAFVKDYSNFSLPIFRNIFQRLYFF